MSEKIGAADSSYDIGYKPKPLRSFFEEAIKAILKCLGADETPSNTTEQLVDKPPATSLVTEVQEAGVVIVARSTLGTGGGAQIN